MLREAIGGFILGALGFGAGYKTAKVIEKRKNFSGDKKMRQSEPDVKEVAKEAVNQAKEAGMKVLALGEDAIQSLREKVAPAISGDKDIDAVLLAQDTEEIDRRLKQLGIKASVKDFNLWLAKQKATNYIQEMKVGVEAGK